MGGGAIWLAIAGLILGALLHGFAGMVFGALLGFLLATTFELSARLKKAETLLQQLGGQQTAAASKKAPPSTMPPPVSRTEAEQKAPSRPKKAPTPPSPEAAVPVSARINETARPVFEIELPEADRGLHESGLWHWVRRFFTDGNAVVRVGIVVLFFGVAFLVKYAADRDLFPIELRLASAALGGMGLIVLGWRLRLRRTTYALLIQGGGIGIFYITVYGAAKIYHLMPLGMAFMLMVAIVTLSALLALLQDSRNLAAFGVSGGFLAPILTSTGEGSHVMLFSYYALLNAGILGIAWFKAWRELNLLGFAFTFIIGSVWGAQYYRPAYFDTTEPFLILFFLFYVAIAVLFALRQPLKLRGYVDGTLVFGVPVVGFALQAALVKDFEYGLAWSSLAMATLYTLLASVLWRQSIAGMRVLTEAFLSLGIVFATLAIPLALDARWTASAWALEGAAILWIGVRQQRLLPRLSGLLLQLGAGISFLLSLAKGSGEIPVLNGACLGAVLIAVAGLFSSFYLQQNAKRLRVGETGLHVLALIWGLTWWHIAGMREIERFVEWEFRLNAMLLFIALSSAALLWLWRRLVWKVLRYPMMLLLPGAALLSMNILDGATSNHFFAQWGLLAWAAVFAVQYRILWRLERDYTDALLRFGHSATLWLLLWILCWEANWWVGQWLDHRGVWDFVVWALLPALMVVVLLGPGMKLKWPVQRWATTYKGEALYPVVAAIWIWSVVAIRSAGDPWPLPYVPLLNPLELSQLLVLLVVLMWCWHNRENSRLQLIGFSMKLGWVASGIGAFVLLNEVVAHAVHYWNETPYHLLSLHRSMVFHASLAVVWTLCALFIMMLATRRRQRMMWLTGATLLGAVVVKLFLIDLSRSDTMERIVSFIAVGLLMLLIGYFSPLPPKSEKEKAQP